MRGARCPRPPQPRRRPLAADGRSLRGDVRRRGRGRYRHHRAGRRREGKGRQRLVDLEVRAPRRPDTTRRQIDRGRPCRAERDHARRTSGRSSTRSTVHGAAAHAKAPPGPAGRNQISPIVVHLGVRAPLARGTPTRNRSSASLRCPRWLVDHDIKTVSGSPGTTKAQRARGPSVLRCHPVARDRTGDPKARLPAVLPAVSRSGSHFLTRCDPFWIAISPMDPGNSGVLRQNEIGLEGRCSIQLSYGRVLGESTTHGNSNGANGRCSPRQTVRGGDAGQTLPMCWLQAYYAPGPRRQPRAA